MWTTNLNLWGRQTTLRLNHRRVAVNFQIDFRLLNDLLVVVLRRRVDAILGRRLLRGKTDDAFLGLGPRLVAHRQRDVQPAEVRHRVTLLGIICGRGNLRQIIAPLKRGLEARPPGTYRGMPKPATVSPERAEILIRPEKKPLTSIDVALQMGGHPVAGVVELQMQT